MIAIISIVIGILGVFATLYSIPGFRMKVRVWMGAPIRITGEVGHLRKAKKFNKFIERSINQIIFIDIVIPKDEFEGSTDNNSPYFVLFDHCVEEDNNIKPSPLRCSGYQYNLTNYDISDCRFYYLRGIYILKGYFAFLGYEGMAQGITMARLKCLKFEDTKL